MKHLIFVGACYLDTILTVPHFPKEDSKLRATTAQVRRGGNCPNTLEVIAQLLRAGPRRLPPIKLHLVSCLPDAQATATSKILASFGGDVEEAEENGIDFSHCLYRQGHDEPASSYIIRGAQTGSRTIVNFNDLPEMTAGEFERIADAFARQGDECWWHFEGRIPETTLRCIRYLRRSLPGNTISVEVEKPNREGLVELAAEADVVFYSRSWAEPRVHQFGGVFEGRSSFIKSEGAGALEVSSGEYTHHPATPSGQRVPVVDTIGAGDTFIAGMLYGLNAPGWSSREKLAFAVRLATKKVQREGFCGLVP
ncbi:Ribokinase-like protein [Parathielavia appendiculata]|uniref:Ribokinase-like protein n=1 Tax=Parathielavia appendiculata TaxID=2587402 RepID=A0AAN6U7D9_9PEZI|nr:Ribokinase-like protein [Parathielavia appendiculata]